MRTAKIGYIVFSILLMAAGCVLMIYPRISVQVVGVLTSIIMILFGIFKVIGYLSKDLYRLAFEYDLALGILLILLGVIELVKPGTLMTVLCVTVGIAALADGLFKIQISINARPFGIRQWWVILAIAVITAGAGIALMLNPSSGSDALMVLFGLTLTVEGILNLITVILTVKIIGHQKIDTIDIQYKEL